MSLLSSIIVRLSPHVWVKDRELEVKVRSFEDFFTTRRWGRGIDKIFRWCLPVLESDIFNEGEVENISKYTSVYRLRRDGDGVSDKL